MKSIKWPLAALTFGLMLSQSAFALSVDWPYWTTEINCTSQAGPLSMRFDSGKSIMGPISIKVAGQEELIRTMNVGQKYSKEGVYSINLPEKEPKNRAMFKCDGSIKGQQVDFYCKMKTGIHIFRKSEETKKTQAFTGTCGVKSPGNVTCD